MAEAPRYRAAAADTRVVTLDALTAIYHRPSGATHVVAAPLPEILVVLDEAGMTAGMVLDALAARYDLPDADRAAVAARLEELADAGLVARA